MNTSFLYAQCSIICIYYKTNISHYILHIKPYSSYISIHNGEIYAGIKLILTNYNGLKILRCFYMCVLCVCFVYIQYRSTYVEYQNALRTLICLFYIHISKDKWSTDYYNVQ